MNRCNLLLDFLLEFWHRVLKELLHLGAHDGGKGIAFGGECGGWETVLWWRGFRLRCLLRRVLVRVIDGSRRVASMDGLCAAVCVDAWWWFVFLKLVGRVVHLYVVGERE